MGCTTCTNNTDSQTAPGCKSNGDCGSGGCERMSVFDWLSDIEMPTGKKRFDCVEVSFKNGRKNFYQNQKNFNLFMGDTIVVEGSPGYDVGIVTLTGELVRHQMNRKGVKGNTRDLKKVYRKANEADIAKWKEARSLEYETMHNARTMASKLNLKMKLGDVEYQGDKTKATFYYTADERVDFRELIKVMADSFKIRIEMRQIGARQEAGRLGGIGACGRELCCSTWLSDFRSVSTSAARYQQLSLNPQKLAGQCGKLKCCLNFELDQYMEALKSYPDTKVQLKTHGGNAIHIKTDVFKRTMWYLVQKEKGGNSIIPLSIERVFEIIEMNKSGEKIESLQEFVDYPEIEEEPDYTNVVGQDDLTRFDQKFKKKKKKKKKRRPNRNQKGKQQKASAQGGGQQKKGGQQKNSGQQKKKPQAKKQGGNAENKGGGTSRNNQRRKGGNNSKNRNNNRKKQNQPKKGE